MEVFLTNNESELNGKNIIYYYLKLENLIIKIKNFEIYMKSIRKEVNEENFAYKDQSNIKNLFQELMNFKKNDELKEVYKIQKVRQIQRWAKLKISKMIKLIHNLEKDKHYFKFLHVKK